MIWRILVCTPLFCLLLAAQQSEFEVDGGVSRWTLSNECVRAVFELDEQGLFAFRSLASLEGNDAWNGAPAVSPIHLIAGNEVLDGSTRFRLVSHEVDPVERSGIQQTIVLEDVRGSGQVAVDLEMYPKQPVLRYRVRFRNMRPFDTAVRAADPLSWTFDGGAHTFRLFRVKQWVNHGQNGNFEPLASNLSAATRPIALYSGSNGQHCAWLAVRDEQDRGIFASLEFDGRATTSLAARAGALEIATTIPDLNRVLPYSAEFVGPYAFVGLFHGDWDEAGYRTQRFTEAVLAQQLPDANFPYVIWDSWKYNTDFDESILRRNAEIAARLGIEVFVVDLGWSRSIGDWHEDPGKFRTGGLRALSDYVHQLGMKFGLHFAFAEAAPTSPILRQHADWRSSENYLYFASDSLCLAHTPVRDWIIAEAVRIIDEYNVDWILQDGENMVKRCTKTTHTHNPDDSNYANAVDGLDYILNAVQQQRPGVHWENCEDGGQMMTYNMVRNYVTSIAADDSGPLTTRQAIFGITYPFPPRYIDRYMPEEVISRYASRSYMFGGPWIFMNRLALMPAPELANAAREIALFKSIRGRIRDGKVFHLTARPALGRIDALESYYAPTDSALVFVFRSQSQRDYQNIRIRGLNPENRYRVTSEDDPALGITATGARLARGIRVTLPEEWSAQLIRVDPVAGSAAAP